MINSYPCKGRGATTRIIYSSRLNGDKRGERNPLTSFIDFTSICREYPYGSLRDAFTISDKGGARRGSSARDTPHEREIE